MVVFKIYFKLLAYDRMHVLALQSVWSCGIHEHIALRSYYYVMILTNKCSIYLIFIIHWESLSFGYEFCIAFSYSERPR